MSYNYLVHSSKGTTWGKHKYVRIENGRYIYPEDLQKSGANKQNKINNVNDKIHPKEMDNHLNRTSYERYHKNKDVHIENNKNKLPTSAYRQSQETNAKYEPFKVVYNDNLPRKVSDPHTNNHNEIFFDGKSWDEFKAIAEKNKKKMQKSKKFIDRLLGR